MDCGRHQNSYTDSENENESHQNCSWVMNGKEPSSCIFCSSNFVRSGRFRKANCNNDYNSADKIFRSSRCDWSSSKQVKRDAQKGAVFSRLSLLSEYFHSFGHCDVSRLALLKSPKLLKSLQHSSTISTIAFCSCLIAFGKSFLYKEIDWDAITLNRILQEGKHHYNKSHNKVRNMLENLMTGDLRSEYYLRIKENDNFVIAENMIEKKFILDEHIVKIEIDSLLLINGVMLSNNSENIPSLSAGLKKFFTENFSISTDHVRKNNYKDGVKNATENDLGGKRKCKAATDTESCSEQLACLLKINEYYILIWCRYGQYFLFDPNGQNKFVEKCNKMGSAVFLCFNEFNSIVEYLNNFNEVKTDDPFSIRKMKITKLERLKSSYANEENDEGIISSEEEIKTILTPTILKYRKCSSHGGEQDFRIINQCYALLESTVNIKKLVMDFQVPLKELLLSSIINVVIYSKIDPPSTWNKQIIDDIIFGSLTDIVKQKDEFYIGNENKNLCKKSSSTNSFDDMNKTVEVGEHTIRVEFKKETKGSWFSEKCDYKKTDLYKKLSASFERLSSILLRVDENFYALFKKNKFFYLYEIRRELKEKKENRTKYFSEELIPVLHMFSSFNLLCSKLLRKILPNSQKLISQFYLFDIKISEIKKTCDDEKSGKFSINDRNNLKGSSFHKMEKTIFDKVTKCLNYFEEENGSKHSTRMNYLSPNNSDILKENFSNHKGINSPPVMKLSTKELKKSLEPKISKESLINLDSPKGSLISFSNLLHLKETKSFHNSKSFINCKNINSKSKKSSSTNSSYNANKFLDSEVPALNSEESGFEKSICENYSNVEGKKESSAAVIGCEIKESITFSASISENTRIIYKRSKMKESDETSNSYSNEISKLAEEAWDKEIQSSEEEEEEDNNSVREFDNHSISIVGDVHLIGNSGEKKDNPTQSGCDRKGRPELRKVKTWKSVLLDKYNEWKHNLPTSLENKSYTKSKLFRNQTKMSFLRERKDFCSDVVGNSNDIENFNRNKSAINSGNNTYTNSRDYYLCSSGDCDDSSDSEYERLKFRKRTQRNFSKSRRTQNLRLQERNTQNLLASNLNKRLYENGSFRKYKHDTYSQNLWNNNSDACNAKTSTRKESISNKFYQQHEKTNSGNNIDGRNGNFMNTYGKPIQIPEDKYHCFDGKRKINKTKCDQSLPLLSVSSPLRVPRSATSSIQSQFTTIHFPMRSAVAESSSPPGNNSKDEIYDLAVAATKSGTFESIFRLLNVLNGQGNVNRVLLRTSWKSFLIFKIGNNWLSYNGCLCNIERFRHMSLEGQNWNSFDIFSSLKNLVEHILKRRNRIEQGKHHCKIDIEEIRRSYNINLEMIPCRE